MYFRNDHFVCKFTVQSNGMRKQMCNQRFKVIWLYDTSLESHGFLLRKLLKLLNK